MQRKPKLNNYELARKIEYEGIGYAVQDYCNPEDIEDQEVAEWWRKAREALDWLTEKLTYDPEG